MLVELHPFVLHFAVGLLLIAPFCDALGLLLRREPLLFTGRWTTLFGTVAALLTVLSGIAAEQALPPHPAAGQPLLRLHSALGYVLIAIWVPVAVWRALTKPAMPVRAQTVYLALALLGGTVVTAETLLGSAMVYRHGVGLSAAARVEPTSRTAPRVNAEKR